MKRLALALMFALGAPMAYADQLIGAYVAYIGQQDLYNSRGARLTEPWQVLRQDRANYHRFGISQPGDEWDPFFGEIDNRAAMERWIMNGYIEPNASRILMQGGATVFVRIYGSNGWGQRIEVTVTN
ncbi:hypothetical protein [Maliponia aquimaris]|uniref:Uncharacterized protein n=1 Tax=Maliponia aquimaris TaxID=1673631 RepID=A0A238L6W4_9RHOB|nr:hypothetical protein [Maliponia aquimaris]SMX50747.1 hypothetical protein MAA8898_04963 [Maliponia aquimaris]